ncbi:glycosyltransferase [Streptomyces anandii]|uniref:glycosyltransferase n=1 Tax=Streptomyces anandii TaxID=285454 RepID=UPI00167BA883|nr:glycosyltransferase [Streptomyces anandii]GGX86028.1 glycosyl transferase family 1 [Streptomyces anandii JCM 4720]
MHVSQARCRTSILHITQPVDGGVARVVTDLVRSQLEEGFDVAVACPGGPFTARLRALGADVRHWPATRSPLLSALREVSGIARVIDAVRPDLVHMHSAKAGLAGRLAVRGRIPTVFQPHAWSFEAVGGTTGAAAVKWEKWAARWTSALVCVSEAERVTGARAGIAGRWRVIPNGIDPERFRPAPDAPGDSAGAAGKPRAARTGHSAPAPHARLPRLAAADLSAPLVVCVGRLCRQKGQDVLLAAWDAIVHRVPDARLVLVGDGPEGARLRRHASTSVLFAGAVADPVPWYRAADLVVLPSRWEGMALAPLEAMACGRPVVVTDVDGARESLPPALAAHCLVPPGNPAALAGTVAELLLDRTLRVRLGELGRRHVLSAHDVRCTTEAVVALYRELLTPRPAAQRMPGLRADGPPPGADPTEHRESIHS